MIFGIMAKLSSALQRARSEPNLAKCQRIHTLGKVAMRRNDFLWQGGQPRGFGAEKLRVWKKLPNFLAVPGGWLSTADTAR
jgi:hypothetical protein